MIDGVSQSAKIVQDGPKSNIICTSCEDVCSKLDHYASIIFSSHDSKETLSLKIKSHFNGRLIERESVDSSRLWKFALSVVLRGHAAGSARLECRRHFEALRNALLCENSNNGDLLLKYPVVLYEITSSGIVGQPSLGYLDGHHYYQFFGAGIVFRLWVSNHKKPDHINELALKKGKNVFSMLITFQEFGDLRSFIPTVKNITRQPKLISKIIRWQNHN